MNCESKDYIKAMRPIVRKFYKYVVVGKTSKEAKKALKKAGIL